MHADLPGEGEACSCSQVTRNERVGLGEKAPPSVREPRSKFQEEVAKTEIKKISHHVLKTKLLGPEEMKQAGHGHCRKPIG